MAALRTTCCLGILFALLGLTLLHADRRTVILRELGESCAMGLMKGCKT